MYYIISDAEKSQEEIHLLRNFFEYLPAKPYCTDALGSLSIRPKSQAVTKPYIQPNPITRAYWLVYDLDNQHDPRYWYDEEYRVPVPNISVANPDNGHEHIYYLIEPPVYTLQQARQKPLEFMADVDRGLTALLDADPSYGKLIAKNPFHERWLGAVWHERAYGLAKLRGWIPDWVFEGKRKRRPREEFGLGRNCTVFDSAREYAYREWRRLKYRDRDRLFEAVQEMARGLNTEFPAPLLDRELLGIVRSIVKWTARHITAEGFSRWCSRRGKIGNIKSQATQKTRSADRAAEAKALYAGGKTLPQIALILDISERQVRNLPKS